MQSPYFDLLKNSDELQASTMERFRELWRSYYADLQRYTADAQVKARGLWQSYLQELRTAGTGDDSAERVATSQSNFQRAYAELDAHYARACREREQKLAEALASLNSDWCQRTLDGMIRYLEAIRSSLPKAAPEGSASSTKS
jgi:hypothetical protein